MGKPDYYRFLGLRREASTSQIKSRYQELAKQYHPDNGGNERIMGRVNEAYSVLSDPKKRFVYNQSLNTGMIKYSRPMDISRPGKEKESNLPELHRNESNALKLYARKSAFGAAITVAVIAIGTLGVLAFTKQSPQKPKTIIISKTELEPSTNNQSNNDNALSQQVSQEEAKVKQEEQQANSDQSLAQQYANEAKTNSQSNNQVSPSNTNTGTTASNTVYPPNTAPLPAHSTSGNLSGNYYYAVSFISNSGVETALGPASASVSVHNQQITLSNIPTGPGNAVARNIYRTKTNGSASGPYYLVKTIYDNTSTNYTDNLSDGGLGTTGKYPS
jgi:curved DNA-binding protein CbpA